MGCASTLDRLALERHVVEITELQGIQGIFLELGESLKSMIVIFPDLVSILTQYESQGISCVSQISCLFKSLLKLIIVLKCPNHYFGLLV
jgi:broad-specificity NMP kinase